MRGSTLPTYISANIPINHISLLLVSFSGKYFRLGAHQPVTCTCPTCAGFLLSLAEPLSLHCVNIYALPKYRNKNVAGVMASESRFTSQNKTTQQRISNNTVGLVALSDFRKRRAEVLEQQEREAREAAIAGSPTSTSTPDRSLTSTPDTPCDPAAHPKKKKKRKVGGAKLSFGSDEDEDDAGGDVTRPEEGQGGGESADKGTGNIKGKFKVNSSVAVVPRSLTKSALRREAAERDALRREFQQRQERVKATEIAIPFVFYDGSNIPGGTVRVKKGDFVWQFLDKSRKVGADLGVGERANARREWARVGVDDLIMVRGNVIIPHVSYPILEYANNAKKWPRDD